MSIARLLMSAWLVLIAVASGSAQSLHDQSLASSNPQMNVVLPADRDNTGLERLSRNGRQTESGAADDATCLFMRSYRVKRDIPGSDATRFAGYSTCTRAARFQTKSAVKPLEIVPR